MKYLMVVVFFIGGAASAQAYDVVVTEVERPYDIVSVSNDFSQGQMILGELEGFPVMYEMVIDSPTDLQIKIRQRYSGSSNPTLFSLIVVRENDDGGGVTEVARLQSKIDDWSLVKESVWGMTFEESYSTPVSLESGVYRVEVSAVENRGQYILMLGDNFSPVGYLPTLKDIRVVQKFFGFSPLRMLTSSYVYYPLGILLLFFIFQRTLKYRKSISYGN